MKKAFWGFLIFTGLNLCAFPALTQTAAGQTPATGSAGRTPARVEDPRGFMIPSGNATEQEGETVQRPLAVIRKEVREKVKLSNDEKDKYKMLAGDKKANVIRILSAFSCSTTMVVDISDPRCSENPDMAVVSYYSFRIKDYGESPWTDLSLVEDEFTAGNKWHTVGYIVDLGETADFAKLDADTEEIKALWEIPGAETYKEKAKQKAELEKGFTSGKLFLSSKVKLQVNHTYLLRTVAYRLDGGFAAFRGGFNWYNTDSLFVFKVAEFDTRRTATLIWKKIFQKVAPILTDKEKEKSE